MISRYSPYLRLFERIKSAPRKMPRSEMITLCDVYCQLELRIEKHGEGHKDHVNGVALVEAATAGCLFCRALCLVSANIVKSNYRLLINIDEDTQRIRISQILSSTTTYMMVYPITRKHIREGQWIEAKLCSQRRVFSEMRPS